MMDKCDLCGSGERLTEYIVVPIVVAAESADAVPPTAAIAVPAQYAIAGNPAGAILIPSLFYLHIKLNHLFL